MHNKKFKVAVFVKNQMTKQELINNSSIEMNTKKLKGSEETKNHKKSSKEIKCIPRKVLTLHTYSILVCLQRLPKFVVIPSTSHEETSETCISKIICQYNMVTIEKSV